MACSSVRGSVSWRAYTRRCRRSKWQHHRCCKCQSIRYYEVGRYWSWLRGEWVSLNLRGEGRGLKKKTWLSFSYFLSLFHYVFFFFNFILFFPFSHSIDPLFPFLLLRLPSIPFSLLKTPFFWGDGAGGGSFCFLFPFFFLPAFPPPFSLLASFTTHCILPQMQNAKPCYYSFLVRHKD